MRERKVTCIWHAQSVVSARERTVKSIEKESLASFFITTTHCLSSTIMVALSGHPCDPKNTVISGTLTEVAQTNDTARKIICQKSMWLMGVRRRMLPVFNHTTAGASPRNRSRRRYQILSPSIARVILTRPWIVKRTVISVSKYKRSGVKHLWITNIIWRDTGRAFGRATFIYFTMWIVLIFLRKNVNCNCNWIARDLWLLHYWRVKSKWLL